MPASSDEDAAVHRRFRPQPPKASPKESARKGFRHVADRRRSGEMNSNSNGTSRSSNMNEGEVMRRSYESSRQENGHSNTNSSSGRHEENGYSYNGSSSSGSGNRQVANEDGKPLSSRDYTRSSSSSSSSASSASSSSSSSSSSADSQALVSLEAEIRVLSLENAQFRTRAQELLERLEKANSMNAHLEAKLKSESGESQQLRLLQISYNELQTQLTQATNTIQEQQERENILRDDLQEQAKNFSEKIKNLNKKLNTMETVQQQVVMENSRLHTEIRKEKNLRQNCEVHLRSYNNNKSNGGSNSREGGDDKKSSPRFARTSSSSDSFLSPDTFSRSRDKVGRSPLRTAGKPSSPLSNYPHHQHHPVPREPPPRLEGVIHLENRGRTNQQTFDLFKPFDEQPPSFSSSSPRTSTPHRPSLPLSSRKLRPSPFPHRTPLRFRDSGHTLSPFSHERDFAGVGPRTSGQLSPPFATNTNRASEMALARLENRLLSLHQEQQDCEDERMKLDRARDTVMGRKRKVELDGILSRLKVEITNVKTAIRRLGLP